MRRLLPALLPLLLAAACDGGPLSSSGPPDAPPALAAQVRVGFPARGLVDTIEIRSIDRLPLRAADLVAPDGTVTAAGYLNVEASPGIASGQWAGANAWSDAVTGNDALAALTLRHAEGGAALRGRQQLLATASVAEITLPDPVAYRRDWQHYRIRLSFGTPPGEVETRESPAPAPPPR